MKGSKKIPDTSQKTNSNEEDSLDESIISRLALLMEKRGIQDIGAEHKQKTDSSASQEKQLLKSFDEQKTRIVQQKSSLPPKTPFNEGYSVENSIEQYPTFSPSLLKNTQNWNESQQSTVIRPGQKIRDTYCLNTKIGGGGMGEVWKAIDLIQDEGDAKNRFVAIKFISHKIKNHPYALKALVREFARYKKLIHPNIVRAYELNRDNNEVFIAMEYLEGGSLKEFIEQHPEGISLKRAQPIIKGMCEALEYAHNEGIVHFDFKPGNVFYNQLTRVCKVIDFGIARLSNSEERDKTRFDPGTLGALTTAYASGEMLMEADPDPRDDIYGLACITYELLSGKHPYNKIMALKAEREKRHPNQISELKKNEFQAILHGLSFRRENRTANAAQFYSELFVPKKQSSKKYTTWPVIAGILIIIPFSIYTLYKGYNSWKLNQVSSNIQQQSVSALDDFVSLSIAEQRELLNTPSLRLALVKHAAIKNNPDNNILSLANQFDPKIQLILSTDREVRKFLIKHYCERIDQAITKNDFELAKKISLNTLELYPDSMQLITQSNKVELQKEKRIETLQQQYHQCLEDNSKNLTDLFPCLQQTQRLLSKIDNSNDLLSSKELTTRYSIEVSFAINNYQLELAETLLANWHALEINENIQRNHLEQNLTDVALNKNQTSSSESQNENINQLLELAEQQHAKKQLMTPLDDNAWQTYQTILTSNPNNESALTGIDTITQTYVLWARVEMKKGNYQHADYLFNQALKVSPDDRNALSGLADLDENIFHPGTNQLSEINNEPVSQEYSVEVSNLLSKAELQIENNQLIAPSKDNAWKTYKKILSLSSANEQALMGINNITKIYLLRAKKKIQIGRYKHAGYLYNRALLISPRNKEAISGLLWLQNNLK